jgi:hypothetical protein
MQYNLAKLPFQDLLAPSNAASAAMARLDERLRRSSEGAGWLARSHYFDACASLWVDGELVHIEELVLHDVGMGVRRPTHALTIAQDVLRTRRRLLAAPPGSMLNSNGVRALQRAGAELETKSMGPDPGLEATRNDDVLSAELAAIDIVLARSEALLAQARGTAFPAAARERDALIYEPDWDEDERLSQWQKTLAQSEGLPAVVRAALVLDAWNVLAVLQHAPWLGRLLAAAVLQNDGLTVNYLVPVSVGLKQVQRDRRAHRHRDIRLLALIEAMREAAEMGLKDHDRLVLARQQMEHRLSGRRKSSKLPQLIDLVLTHPIVSTAMIVDALSVTPQGAVKIANELNLREVTGRGRFRAWGIL